jgi:hypothetical protein
VSICWCHPFSTRSRRILPRAGHEATLACPCPYDAKDWYSWTAPQRTLHFLLLARLPQPFFPMFSVPAPPSRTSTSTTCTIGSMVLVMPLTFQRSC